MDLQKEVSPEMFSFLQDAVKTQLNVKKAINSITRPLVHGEERKLNREEVRELRRRQTVLHIELTRLVRAFNVCLDSNSDKEAVRAELFKLDMEYKSFLRENEKIFLYENLSNEFLKKVDMLIEIRKQAALNG
jgi:hypothetical protein